MSTQPHVVIIGGGFGGLYAARGLRKTPVRVTLIDRRNFHLFQPLLYQVATGALSPANIAAPLRALFTRQRNVRVLMAEITGFEAGGKRVLLKDGTLDCDLLILATGARHHYFGKPEWEELAPGLKTIEDATEIRRRVLSAFERAERETDPNRIRALLTFVVIGGGPTGVELAGAVAEVARYTLRDNFRTIDPRSARILLLEGADRVLTAYHPGLSSRAARELEQMGVVVRTRTLVTDIRPLARASGSDAGDPLSAGLVLTLSPSEELLHAHTVLWAAGVQASPLGAALAAATGATIDRVGRVVVGPDLSIPGHPDIFVIGDLSSYSHQSGKPLPGIAPVAMQQGRFVARLIQKRLAGETAPTFHYTDRGSMATIGRARAVADLGWIRFGGYLAWLAWLFIHLLYIVEFQNRLLVLMQWAWNYVTRGRSARLITREKLSNDEGRG